MNDTNLAARPASPPAVSPTLLRHEQGAMADFLVALADFDRAGAYRRLGFANLFDYLLRELKLSRGAAQVLPLLEAGGDAGRGGDPAGGGAATEDVVVTQNPAPSEINDFAGSSG